MTRKKNRTITNDEDAPFVHLLRSEQGDTNPDLTHSVAQHLAKKTAGKSGTHMVILPDGSACDNGVFPTKGMIEHVEKTIASMQPLFGAVLKMTKVFERYIEQINAMFRAAKRGGPNQVAIVTTKEESALMASIKAQMDTATANYTEFCARNEREKKAGRVMLTAEQNALYSRLKQDHDRLIKAMFKMVAVQNEYDRLSGGDRKPGPLSMFVLLRWGSIALIALLVLYYFFSSI